MRKFLKSLMATLLVVCALSVSSQTDTFIGSIEYDISFPGMTLDPMMKAFLPYSVIDYYGDNMMKTVQLSGESSQTVIVDGNNKMTYILIYAMGEKYMVKQPIDEEQVTKALEDIKIDATEETKKIIGYDCTLYNISFSKDASTPASSFYVCKELTNPVNKYSETPIPDGIPLEYSISTDGFNIKLTALKIKKQKIKASTFDIPEGYKEVTMDELKGLGGGM